MALVWLLFLGLALACFCCMYCRLKFVRCFRKFPGPKGWPIIGNSLVLLGSQADFLRLLMTEGKKSTNGTLCLWVGMRPFVFLHKADVIQLKSSLGLSLIGTQQIVSYFGVKTEVAQKVQNMAPKMYEYECRQNSPLLSSHIHIEKNFEYTLAKDWLGDGLITNTGAKWIKHRQLLTPSFHFNFLKLCSIVVWKQSLVFVDQLTTHSNKGAEINIFPLAKRLALDLICETALGTSVSAQLNEDSEYVLAIERLTKIMCRRFITPLLKPNLIFNMSPLGWEQKKLLKVINGFVNKVIEERKSSYNKSNKQNGHSQYNENNEEKDLNIEFMTPTNIKNYWNYRYNAIVPEKNITLLDLLLGIAKQDSTISEKDILDEVNTFMFAGHDTISSAISFTLFILGHNPEWQDKIVKEIEVVCPDIVNKHLAYDKIKQLDVLDRCIKEALRLFPPSPLFGRTIRSPLETPAGVLAPGTTAVVNILLLHRDAEVFSEPEKFDPDRFLPHNLHKNSYAYIPFSAGPRNCIGKRLALLELKIVLAMVLTKFEVKSIQFEEELELSYGIVLFCENEMKLVLKERTQNVL